MCGRGTYRVHNILAPLKIFRVERPGSEDRSDYGLAGDLRVAVHPSGSASIDPRAPHMQALLPDAVNPRATARRGTQSSGNIPLSKSEPHRPLVEEGGPPR